MGDYRAKWHYQMKRREERRNNRTPEQKFEHSQLRLESVQKKSLRELEKIFEKYNLYIKDEPNRNTDSEK